MNVHKKLIVKRIITTVLSMVIICFIFSQSMLPAVKSGAESGRVVAFLNSISSLFGLGNVFTDSFVRTCAHFTEFAILGFTLFAMFSTYLEKLQSRFIHTCITYSLVAVCDEIIQLFSEGRSFQFKDICIDILGATAGALFIFALLVLISKHRRTND